MSSQFLQGLIKTIDDIEFVSTIDSLAGEVASVGVARKPAPLVLHWVQVSVVLPDIATVCLVRISSSGTDGTLGDLSALCAGKSDDVRIGDRSEPATASLLRSRVERWLVHVFGRKKSLQLWDPTIEGISISVMNSTIEVEFITDQNCSLLLSRFTSKLCD